MKLSQNISFAALSSFDMSVSYVEIDSLSALNQNKSHTHSQCEIYINLSGDVSFAVENKLYPIAPGNIIITRPYEYHHCIYNSNDLHKHFWILLSPSNNVRLFDMFFDRKSGEQNLLSLPPQKTEKLISICHQLSGKKLGEIETYRLFFSIIELLREAAAPKIKQDTYPDGLTRALTFISTNFSDEFSMEELAEKSFVSINTLERYFSEYIKMTPSAFLRQKRLSNAAKLLADGCSVSNACELSGFSDYSHFIVLFKKAYGMTPFQYKTRKRNTLTP